ncbi:MAG TPA: HD domain-containing protein [Terracidiphilus sp.]|jgi:HD domain
MFWATQVTLPIEVAGVRIPNTSLANEATQFVSGVTPLWLLNPLLRTYDFAELLGRSSAMKYDSELLYLGAMMHDLGLTDEFAGIQRFELDGADAASRFLQKHGVSKRRIQLVWDSIAFHTLRWIYDRMRAEVALVGYGVLADTIGTGIDKLSAKQVREVLETWPRHGFRYAFPQLVAEIVGRKPETAAGSFAADVLRQRGIEVPNIFKDMDLAAFEGRSG